MSRNIVFLVIVILGGLMLQSCQYAQLNGPRVQQARTVAETAIHIVNGSDRNLIFKLSADRARWTQHRLGAKTEDWYEADNSRGAWISIHTDKSGDEVITYQLQSGMTYCLYWNKDFRRWDLKQQRII